MGSKTALQSPLSVSQVAGVPVEVKGINEGGGGGRKQGGKQRSDPI